MSIEFLLTALVIVATPGTGVLFTVAAGLSRGVRASAVAAFACTLGTLPHLLAALTGLAALLHTSATAFEVLKYLGVAYLLYLAWATVRDKSTFEPQENVPVSPLKVITTGVLANILNPKLTIFFVAFLPQFVQPGEPVWRMVEMSAVFTALTLVVFLGYGAFAAAVRDHIIARPKVLAWTRRSFAAAFAGLGFKLAVTEA
ncbi:LysE family translocator [Amycolatopsis magusensis]|uniref:Threonine/homoserine/homoserine lactone efflux protein n=1 Tax=Amycolatopsis magusensis TaxID=882444 RepID=A0ABS4PGM1_9PSEU|nr:LysE family translocator [Amycolatopsis magusensis]MBP2178549.1 threonine/homoserine/homoserine lactone efflux protein [Amycolatopsis magusensis]